jgi:hypothetical protein
MPTSGGCDWGFYLWNHDDSLPKDPKVIHHYLVGGFNPSEKYESQLGWLFQIYGKMFQTTNHNSSRFSWDLTFENFVYVRLFLGDARMIDKPLDFLGGPIVAKATLPLSVGGPKGGFHYYHLELRSNLQTHASVWKWGIDPPFVAVLGRKWWLTIKLRVLR